VVTNGPGRHQHLLAPTPIVARVVLVGAAAGFVAAEVRRRVVSVLQEQAERGRIVGLFGRHVSPQVVDALLAQHRELGSQMRYVAVMFLDIRDFTTLSEWRSPVEVVELLNETFNFIIAQVNAHDGIVNKFLGDGFMAIFGAPLSDGRDRENAVATGLAILDRLAQERAAGRLPAELRHSRRRGGNRQHRLLDAQGVHGDRRCGERRLPHRGPDQEPPGADAGEWRGVADRRRW